MIFYREEYFGFFTTSVHLWKLPSYWKRLTMLDLTFFRNVFLLITQKKLQIETKGCAVMKSALAPYWTFR